MIFRTFLIVLATLLALVYTTMQILLAPGPEPLCLSLDFGLPGAGNASPCSFLAKEAGNP